MRAAADSHSHSGLVERPNIVDATPTGVASCCPFLWHPVLMDVAVPVVAGVDDCIEDQWEGIACKC